MTPLNLYLFIREMSMADMHKLRNTHTHQILAVNLFMKLSHFTCDNLICYTRNFLAWIQIYQEENFNHLSQNYTVNTHNMFGSFYPKNM